MLQSSEPTTPETTSATTPRRRSTFYVPLVPSESDDSNQSEDTIQKNLENLKNLCDLQSSLENSKNYPNTVEIMTPTPCGFDWIKTGSSKKSKNDLNDNDYIISKNSNKHTRFSNSSDKSVISPIKTPTKSITQIGKSSSVTERKAIITTPTKATATLKTLTVVTPTKSPAVNKIQHSKVKRYGIVLNGISLDNEVSCDNTESTLMNSMDYDDDSEISRMQTNTSTPIKMMKSRSRTNILSVPVTEGSLIITTVTTTSTAAVPPIPTTIQSPSLLKEKSKTLPQNLSPSVAMAAGTTNIGSIANVNSTSNNIVSSTFPPKNLFLLKSTPKLVSASTSTKNYSASDSSIQHSPSQRTPPKKSLSFIRRAHSTKLSRSNSLLKSLTSSSTGSMKLQNSSANTNLYLGYEVRPLPFERLEKFYKSDRCVEMIREYFMVKFDDDHVNLINDKDKEAEQGILDEENAIHSDTSYEKACRRGSAPATPVLGQKQQQSESHNTTSRFTNFFSKRSNPLKRTKSVTKLERAKRGPGGLRGSRSHESLLSSHAVMSTIDLSSTGAVGVAPVHQSVLGRRHCFQVRGGPRGERYYSCGSRQERDLWIYSLRKSIAPNAEHTRRTDNSLKMWIYEAKNLPSKKKYFCEINLDKTLYGRTSVKLQTDLLFWGEYFDFPDIPDINVITVHVYREIEKKKKRDKHVFIGSVKIPIHDVTSRLFSEDWYPILSEKHDSIGRNSSKEVIPTLRIKCRFQSIDILPLPVYDEFLQYLKENYKKICEILEPVIGVKAKEDIGQALVLLMHAQGLAGQFLTDVVALDLLRVGDQRLTFRGNSLATKSMEAFLKLTGEQYLQETLSIPINEIIQSDRDCEVDPLKASGSLTRQQQALRNAVKSAWTSIFESHKLFPTQLRDCFATFRERLEQLDREDMADNLISASIFLRFLCPAILSPSLFNITNELPSSRATRNLTLVAKTLQTLANFTRFQGKENFMEFLNDFLELEAPKMKEFLKLISTRPEHPPPETILDWSGYIDQGKQLSILYQLLLESLSKLPEAQQRDLHPLQSILDEITKAKETNSYLEMNQENQNPPSQAPTTRLVPAERGIMRGVLTPSSLEKNIFRYNDPTVSPLLRQSSNSQSSINGSQYSNNYQHLQQTQLQHSQSQSSIASSQNGIFIPTSIQHHVQPIINTQERINPLYNRSNSNYHYFPSNGNLNNTESSNVVRSNTLPRNNGNYDEVGGNLIQIGLEPASAFVRKSPTPLLKSSQNSVKQRIGSQLSLDRTPSKSNLGIPDATAHHNSPIMNSPLLVSSIQQQHQNPNSNMPMKLEEFDDLLRYGDQHCNEKPKEHLTSKGSNISIGHCSSGYQSINTPPSQSSSPVEQQQQQQQQKQEHPHNQPQIEFGKRRLNSNNNNSNNNNNSGKNIIQPPLAFKNPLYQLQQSSSASSSSSSSTQHILPVNTITTKYIYNGNKKAIRATSSSLTPSSSEERLSNDNYNSVNYNNHLVNSPSGHIDAHRTLSGSSSSGGSGNRNMPRTNPLMQYKRDDYSIHDNYLPIHIFPERSVRDTRDTGLYTNGHHHYHNGNSNNQVNGVGLPVVNDSVVVAQPRYQRRLSLDSARTLSDSSTDTEGVSHNVEGKRRRAQQQQHRSSELSEIQRLQQSLDSLRHKLDQDAAELRDSSDDIFQLHVVATQNNHPNNENGDTNMRGIISKLISMEEELRREQLKMSLALTHKQRVIEAQGQQIAALDAANNRLLSALSTLRQRYETQSQTQQSQQPNGNC